MLGAHLHSQPDLSVLDRPEDLHFVVQLALQRVLAGIDGGEAVDGKPKAKGPAHHCMHGTRLVVRFTCPE